MSQPLQSSTASRGHSIDGGAAALWASAFVIGALILVQAGERRGPSEAYAGNVAELGPMRLLTADAGGNEEVLVILNGVDETISVYGVQNTRSVELFQISKVDELFVQARGGAGGGNR